MWRAQLQKGEKQKPTEFMLKGGMAPERGYYLSSRLSWHSPGTISTSPALWGDKQRRNVFKKAFYLWVTDVPLAKYPCFIFNAAFLAKTTFLFNKDIFLTHSSSWFAWRSHRALRSPGTLKDEQGIMSVIHFCHRCELSILPLYIQ